MRRFRFLFLGILLILVLVQCTSNGDKLSPEAEALLIALNDSVEPFDHKADVAQARSLVVESINKGLLENDSLVMVETITPDGIYQCIAYIYHNKMITFHNVKKSNDSLESFSKVQIAGTPYEALAFVDAIQVNKFDSYLAARSKDLSDSNDWWLISFISKEKESFRARNYISK